MSKILKLAVSVLSLISVITMPEVAKAAVSCEANTANNYSNGSLASCVLSFDANIGLNKNNFACQKKEYISFDEKGQFTSCTLARDLQLRSGNKITNCLAKGVVNVSISSTGIQSISCSRIAVH